MKTPEQTKSDFLRHLEQTQQILPLESGEFVYWPSGAGALSGWMLQAIVDRLAELNKPLDEELEALHSSKPVPVEQLVAGMTIEVQQHDRTQWLQVERVVDTTSDPVAPVFWIDFVEQRSMAVYPGSVFNCWCSPAQALKELANG